jgi:chromosomal replication initiation ATPase DnaA
MENTLNIVAAATRISHHDILSNTRTAEIVDARHLLIQALYIQGHHTATIANFAHVTPRTVRHAISNFQGRISQSRQLRQKYEAIKREISKQSEITTAPRNA